MVKRFVWGQKEREGGTAAVSRSLAGYGIVIRSAWDREFIELFATVPRRIVNTNSLQHEETMTANEKADY